MIDTPYLVAAVVAVLLLAVLVIARRRRSPAEPVSTRGKTDAQDTVAGWPPQATRVLSAVERKAFETLRAAFPAHIILAQVPLARFIKVPTRNSYAEWLRRAGQLCADLVVCDRYSQVIAVVELRRHDEASLPRVEKRQKRLIRVLQAADIAVHEWAESALPTVEQAREAIAPSPVTQPGVAPVGPLVEKPAPVRAAEPPRRALIDDPLDAPGDEIIEMREPPPSTWYDDLDSAAAPLEQSRTGGRNDPPKR